MARSKSTVLALVPSIEARDPLAQKLDDLATNLADTLMVSAEINEKIDGLKALSSYYQATRGKGTGAVPTKNAFDAYRSAQGGDE